MAVVRTLRQRDPRAALAFARGLEDDEPEGEVLQRMAIKDPEGAAAELALSKGQHPHVVQAIAGAMMKKDRAMFDAWMGSLKDPGQRLMALATALNKEFQPEPKIAAMEVAEWFAKEPALPENGESLTADIAQRWIMAEGPPAEVAAWAGGLPEGPARNGAVSTTGHMWIQQDRAAAAAWLSSLPQSRGKDGAVLSLVMAISGEAPEDAFEWALTISSPYTRSDALRRTVESWAGNDPDAAGKAVETLSGKERDSLREVLEAAWKRRKAKDEREKATESR